MASNQTSFLILGMLSIESNKSGYDIRKAVESSVSYFWRESYGQIYPTLKRLAAEGMIVPRRSSTRGRPERQEYTITARGSACLREWLESPYREDPPRNEFLLKLFFGRSVSREVCLRHIKGFQDKSRQMLATLEELQRQAQAHNADNPHQPFWALTLSFGIAHERASLDWSHSAFSMLSPAKKRAEKS